jgi:protoporphyrinogen oxidase
MPIGSVNPNQKITIIGGGVSGLLLAFYLKKNNFNFVLYEKESHVGGLIQTQHKQEGIVETAANAIFSNDLIFELLNELKLTPLYPPKKIKKLVQRENLPSRIPFSLSEFLKAILNLFFTKVPLKKNQTVAEFFTPLLGEKLTEEVVSTGLSGIYATPSDQLDFESIFGEVVPGTYFNFFKTLKKKKKLERLKEKKAHSLGFTNGMSEFIKALENYSRDHILLNQNIDQLPDNCILCTSAFQAAKLLAKNPKVQTELLKIQYQPVSTTTFFTTTLITKLKGCFGILFSRKTKFFVNGILANGEIYQTSNRVNSYTMISSLSEDKSLVAKDINQFIGQSQLRSSYETQWKEGIPIYNLNRRLALENLSNMHLNFALFGNYVEGISIREMNQAAFNFVNHLKNNLKN